ncbi:hypothetical protein M0Q28_06475 [Patescibacteria group bacterium]|jgi:hypothetical protein|nr:hypothetical protein [Patescibacteria group bacterium]
MPRGKTENLVPQSKRTKAKQREIAREGGKASGVARREKKLMSQIYGEFLAERFAVTVDGKKQDMTGEKLVNRVVKKVLIAGGPSAVSLMREIREATEGSKIAHSGSVMFGNLSDEDLEKLVAEEIAGRSGAK